MEYAIPDKTVGGREQKKEGVFVMKDGCFEYRGGNVSAEDYVAALQGTECAAAQAAESGCCRCRGECCPEPVDSVEEGCCCRRNFRVALNLLGENPISELVDFDRAVFITDHYAAGAELETSAGTETPEDNLVEPLTGIFRRVSPCTCDLLEISAPLYTAPDDATGLTVTRVNLCELVAVAIDLVEAEGEGEFSAEDVAARNFRTVRRYLTARTGGDCDREQICACACGKGCCCAAGVLAALEGDAINRRVTLAAGPFLLSGVTLLGAVGNVLVLANEEAYRLYFVCANAVEFFV